LDNCTSEESNGDASQRGPATDFLDRKRCRFSDGQHCAPRLATLDLQPLGVAVALVQQLDRELDQLKGLEREASRSRDDILADTSLDPMHSDAVNE
jgi:hypothetical protein